MVSHLPAEAAEVWVSEIGRFRSSQACILEIVQQSLKLMPNALMNLACRCATSVRVHLQIRSVKAAPVTLVRGYCARITYGAARALS